MPPKAFKPPRPSAPQKSSKEKSNPKSTSKHTVKSTSRTASKPHSTASDSDDPFASDKEAESNAEEGADAQLEGLPSEAEEEQERESIPPALLTKLMHEFFKEPGTRLKKDANDAVGKYMDTFVREALARAAYMRVEMEGERGGGNGFLEVEHLERLAPQLLLDF